MSNGEKGTFKSTLESLFNGMDAFLSTKTVIGEPIHIDETIILPLVEVSFGVGAGAFDKGAENNAGGGMGGKLTPSAVLVITNGSTRLIDIKHSSGFDKILDMVPDFVNKFKGSDKNQSRKDASEALEETIVEASKVD